MQTYINKFTKILLILLVLFTLCGCQNKSVMYLIVGDPDNPGQNKDQLISEKYSERILIAYDNIKEKYSKYKGKKINSAMYILSYHVVNNEGDIEYHTGSFGTAGEYICDPYEEYFDIWREYLYEYSEGKYSYPEMTFLDQQTSFAEADRYIWFNKEFIEFCGTTFSEDFEEVEWRTYFVNKNSDFNKMSEHFYGTSDMEDEGKTILDIYLELTDNSPKLNQEVIYKGFRFKSIGFDSETHYFLVKLC